MPSFTTTLEHSIHAALALANSKSHEFATLEHLLLTLIDEPDAQRVLKACDVDLATLREALVTFIDEELSSMAKEDEKLEATPTAAFQRVNQRAAIHVQSSGRSEVTGANVLVAIFAERESNAAYFLQEQEMTRYDAVNFIAHGVAKNSAFGEQRSVQGSDEDGDFATSDAEPETDKKESALSKYCVDLNAKALDGDIDPLIGRDFEVERCVQVLCRRRKNNPLLVGDPGVGKTAIAEGLALKIISKDTPEVLSETTIFSLDMGALLAGTRYRGDFEERVQDLIGILKDRQDIILFIDEIHTIMGAGSAGGQSPDLANLIKPVLESGSLKIIGATTWDEYRSTVEKDTAINRRFNTVEIVEPDVTTAKDIVKGNINPYELHHHVVYNPEAVNAVVELAKDHVHAKQLPDSAFDVLDRAGARQKVLEDKEHWEITKDDIKYEISKMSNIPVELLGKAKENNDYVDIEVNIGKKVFGQDEAITKLADSVYIAQSGLKELTKPIGNYLFTGPTGVGKTETCKTLAEALGMKLLRYDMSEYQERHSVSRLIGAPPGYMGYDEGGAGSGELINKLKETPNAVLLFDEVEKANPDVLNILLQIMDNGIVTGSNGQTANARNAIVIMTSNLGAADAEKRVIGFGQGYNDSAQEEAVKKHFAPEFRNRLDAVIIFKKLDKKIIKHIAKRLLTELQHQVNAVQGVGFSWSKEAIDLLAKEGFSETMGARPMKRVINEQIKRPLARRVLFNKGEKLKVANLVTVENKLELEFE